MKSQFRDRKIEMKNKGMKYGDFHNSVWRKLHHGQRSRGHTLKERQ